MDSYSIDETVPSSYWNVWYLIQMIFTRLPIWTVCKECGAHPSTATSFKRDTWLLSMTLGASSQSIYLFINSQQFLTRISVSIWEYEGNTAKEREKDKEWAIQFMTSILMRILGKMTMPICKSQKNNMIHYLNLFH